MLDAGFAMMMLEGSMSTVDGCEVIQGRTNDVQVGRYVEDRVDAG